MKAKRKHRDKEFKIKVTIEAMKGEKQIAELAAEFKVHPQQITEWKKELLDKGPELFSTKAESDVKKIEKEREQLYMTIGHQQVRNRLRLEGVWGNRKRISVYGMDSYIL